MPDITIASTTDAQEDVNIAAGLPAEGDKPEEQEVDPKDPKESKKESDSETDEPEAEKKSAKPAAASETADDEEEVEEEEEEETEEPEPKGKGKFQKRIDRLTEDKYALQEVNDDLQRRLEELQKNTKSSSKEEPRPARDKFKTDEEFHEALGNWIADKKILEQQTQNAAAEQQAILQETYNTYNAAVTTFKEEHDDYDEVVGSESIRIPTAVQVAVVELGEEGPQMAYYLGQHPEFCKKLMRMTPARAVAEVGRVLGTLTEKEEVVETPAPTRKRSVSGAPAPVKKVAASNTSSTVALDQLPMDEYKRIRREQERARNRRN